MGRYDWSVESDASIVSQNNTHVTLRVNCYFKNNGWDYYMYMQGFTSCSDGGMTAVSGRVSVDTRPWGKNGRGRLGSHDYIIAKSRGGHNVRYSARVMSDAGYANGDKWSAENSAWIPSLASYTISYNANGGSGAPGNQTRWYGQGDFYLSNTRPSRTGYAFKGWATSPGGGVAYQPGQHYGGDANLNLYAVWQINTYTVTFKDGYSGATLKTQSVNYGDSASAPSVSRTGYTHTGWDRSFSNVTSNITVNATWRINQYALDVNMNLDGAQHNTGLSNVGTFDVYINGALDTNDAYGFWRELNYGTKYSVQDIMAKTGYTYTGSSGALSGSIPAYAVGITLNFKTKKYTLSFNQNTSDQVTNMPSSMTKTHFQPLKLPTNIPERRRYEFLGWATSSGGNVVYRAGDTYSTEGDATLYAVWKLKASIISVYNTEGSATSGICSIYDDDGNHHYAILWVYDSNGNRREVI